MKKSKFVPLEQVELQNGFWQERYQLNKEVSLENVRLRFEESGRMDALRFNFLKKAAPLHVYFDSDVAKWMEAVCLLAQKDREGMKQQLEVCRELVSSMEQAQREDGYLNSFHQQKAPEKIFRERNNHELYCAGHLMEAAIVYDRVTGDHRFLQVMERYCDCIKRVFMEEKSAAFVTPGHEEIELALLKLYAYTKNVRYLELARFFLTERGRGLDPYVAKDSPENGQDDVDIFHLHEAKGHAVRALYLYCGIADLVKETGDEALLSNLKDVFCDISQRKMYLTGGVGSSRRGECFTAPYQLPNHTAYGESCASIAQVLFCLRMRELDVSSRYGDVAERALYNGVLSSTSLDGKAFFYENPLELAMEDYAGTGKARGFDGGKLPLRERVELFDCSCCPPNINRFFAQLPGFVALEEQGHLTVEQYIPSTVNSEWGSLTLIGDYAREGKMTVTGEGYKGGVLALRIPAWCKELELAEEGKALSYEVEGGYALVQVGERFSLSLDFHIAPRFVRANPRVRENAGRVALTYGPLVYCLEGVDNGPYLNQLEVDVRDADKAEFSSDFHGFDSVTLPGRRLQERKELYYDAEEIRYTPCTLRFIPYYAFANRGESDMLVWVRANRK